MKGLAVLVLALLPALPALAQQGGAPVPPVSDAASESFLEQARRYHEGRGVTQNFARAADLYRQAAEAGNAEAQNALGRYHHEGLGVPKDDAEALRWLERAAESGEPQYLLDLAVVLEQGAGEDQARLARAADLYRRAAGAGLQDAAVSLGVLYQEGRGVARDVTRARQLYEEAAAAGHARAQNNLGLLYVRGSGVARDYGRAATLFAAAAEQGLKQALTNLGVMYENGFGVPLDEARAAELYRQAGQGSGVPLAQGGFIDDPRLMPVAPGPESRAQLERAAAAGDPVAEFQLALQLVVSAQTSGDDLPRAAALFADAAGKGHPPSMVNLAQMHLLGRGVPQDYVLAQMWLLRAATAGSAEADIRRSALEARMTPGQINEAQARAEVSTPQARR